MNKPVKAGFNLSRKCIAMVAALTAAMSKTADRKVSQSEVVQTGVNMLYYSVFGKGEEPIIKEDQ